MVIDEAGRRVDLVGGIGNNEDVILAGHASRERHVLALNISAAGRQAIRVIKAPQEQRVGVERGGCRGISSVFPVSRRGGGPGIGDRPLQDPGRAGIHRRGCHNSGDLQAGVTSGGHLNGCVRPLPVVGLARDGVHNIADIGNDVGVVRSREAAWQVVPGIVITVNTPDGVILATIIK